MTVKKKVVPNVRKRKTSAKNTEPPRYFGRPLVDESFDSPAWQGCLFWYSVSAYNFISAYDFDVVKGVVDAANEFNNREPLHMRDKKGLFSKTVLPILGEKSGPYCIALMGSFLVWTQKQLADNELPDSPILTACYEGFKFWRLDGEKNGNAMGE